MAIRATKADFERFHALGATLGPSVQLPEEPARSCDVQRRSKYGNVKQNGFDSRKEERIYADLCACERAGVIRNLRRQVPFELVVNGQLICRYKADFDFERKCEHGWERLVVDVKSEATRKIAVYRIKKKLMKAIHRIDVVEM